MAATALHTNACAGGRSSSRHRCLFSISPTKPPSPMTEQTDTAGKHGTYGSSYRHTQRLYLSTPEESPETGLFNELGIVLQRPRYSGVFVNPLYCITNQLFKQSCMWPSCPIKSVNSSISLIKFCHWGRALPRCPPYSVPTSI